MRPVHRVCLPYAKHGRPFGKKKKNKKSRARGLRGRDGGDGPTTRSPCLRVPVHVRRPSAVLLLLLYTRTRRY